ncbi:MAG: glycosyltransferase family 4 protein [Verrucomicrobiae bacterium]|nr:glycosyltransferase family 4 protein [Verrucomicrobiae bacterium]
MHHSVAETQAYTIVDAVVWHVLGSWVMTVGRGKRILMLGYLPPPYFGPSVNYQALMRSQFARHFDVTFLDITVTANLAELETFRASKLGKLFWILLREIGWLLRRRFDFCCAPVSVNRNAFLKDALLLGVARAFGVRTVLYAHGNNLPDFYQRSAPWLQRVMDRTFRNAAGAIVLGETLRFNFERWLPPERILVVPAGVETWQQPVQPVAHDGVNVLYLGNLIREKGVFVLLEAARLLHGKRPDLQFVFAGPWRQREDERAALEFVAQHGLTDCVRFVGAVNGRSKMEVLAQADILVFPTMLQETMGLVLVEAMQAGLPVVTSRLGGIPEVVTEGVNGLFAEVGNPEDLAARILQLANDPALRARMGAANRECFLAYYTHEAYGKRMIAAFEALAAGASKDA